MNNPTVEAEVLKNILYRLRETFGEDFAQVFTGAHFRVAGETSRIVAFPKNIEELSETLHFASSERWKVIPAGAGGWLEVGNRPAHFDLAISTSRMNRVLEYQPADLTATLEAGCTLAAFNKLAAEHKQFIPLDPFGDDNSTLGGIIATASSGPLRCAYGTPRDWLIGIRVVHADGTITSAGGKVVKNVAGYDLCKLYAGSYGTLAMIGEMSFKLRALPPSEKTLIIYSDGAGELFELVKKITASDLQPAAMELISAGRFDLPIEPDRFALALRFMSEAETVDSQIGEVMSLCADLKRTTLSSDDAKNFWFEYRLEEDAARWGYYLKLSALPAEMESMIAGLDETLPKAHWRAHAANGAIRVHAEPGWLEEFKHKERARKLSELRRRAQARGGQMVIYRASADVMDQLDVWGEAGATATIMRSIKEKFDPDSMLNPGRFVAGI